MENDEVVEQVNAVADQVSAIEPYLPYIVFVLIAYIIYKKFRYHQLKKDYEALQEQMDRVLLREQAVQTQQGQKAELVVDFVKLADESHHKLRIRNLNQALANNIRIDFPSGNNLLLKKEVDAIFPVASLNKHKEILLSIAVYNNAPRKIDLELIWDDGYNMNNAQSYHASY